MSKTYKVAYAGIPSTVRAITANSPREAALAFFKTKPLGNPVIVRTGLLSEESFRWSDFARDAPDLLGTELPIEEEKLPHYEPRRDLIIRLFRGSIVFAGVFLLAAAWILSDRDGLPAVATVLISLSGFSTILIGALTSARTLRRYLARDPHSLDAR